MPVVSIALLRPIPTVATPSPHPAAPDNSMNTVQRPFSDPTGLSRPRTALAPNPISHPTPITPIRKTLDGKLMGQPFDPLKWLEPVRAYDLGIWCFVIIATNLSTMLEFIVWMYV